MSLRRILDVLALHHANNVATLRKSPLAEISGSLGDLGTLLPIMIALAVNGSISLSSTLVFSGVWNILTGIAFGVPLTVQPMKVRTYYIITLYNQHKIVADLGVIQAIAAVAIAQKYSIQENVSAGFTTSGVVLLLSVTGLLQWFTRVRFFACIVYFLKHFTCLGSWFSLSIGVSHSMKWYLTLPQGFVSTTANPTYSIFQCQSSKESS